jgi:hypothetical protein
VEALKIKSLNRHEPENNFLHKILMFQRIFRKVNRDRDQTAIPCIVNLPKGGSKISNTKNEHKSTSWSNEKNLLGEIQCNYLLISVNIGSFLNNIYAINVISLFKTEMGGMKNILANI